ncbi:MAG: calcium-binding protein, partial [Halodesulfovibrio sp.]|uniref:calcium-binding protein n=1 Tax=Halodesulfovibrio sp. TaxID=1912772 RepID=UPI00359E5698
IVNAGSGNDTVTAGDTVTIINGGSGDDTITTGSAGDTISGGSDNDTINAGGGNDVVIGGSGNDIITGGTGEDSLSGGLGSDTYIFNLGDGHDIIRETILDSGCQCVDILKFGVGISIEDLRYHADGDDLVISFRSNDCDSIRIVGAHLNQASRVEILSFADGTSLDISSAQPITELTENADFLMLSPDHTSIINGNGGDDFIMMSGSAINIIDGGLGADKIFTGTGDDILYGGAGDDIITSGTGVDFLHGGSGADTLTALGEATFVGGAGDDIMLGAHFGDTYVFNKGDGRDVVRDNASLNSDAMSHTDTLKFGEGISLEDLRYQADGSDLIISLRNSENDSIRIANSQADPTSKIELLSFADGKSFDLSAVEQVTDLTDNADFLMLSPDHTSIVNGNGGDDVIMMSGSAANIIDGGAGDDKLFTAAGNDLLYGGTGADIITSGTGVDYLHGGSGADTLSALGEATFVGGADDDVMLGAYFGDTYVFNEGDGRDIIRDNASLNSDAVNHTDTLKFGEGISKDDLAFFMDGDNLVIAVGTDDQVTIANQANSSMAIETIQLNSESSLSSVEINQIVSDMANYASEHGIDFTSVNDVKQNQELLNIVTAAWDN